MKVNQYLIINTKAPVDSMAVALRKAGYPSRIENDGLDIWLFTSASRTAQVMVLGGLASAVRSFPN